MQGRPVACRFAYAASTGIIYYTSFLDLQKAGPTVIETQAESAPITLNDGYFRFTWTRSRRQVPDPTAGLSW